MRERVFGFPEAGKREEAGGGAQRAGWRSRQRAAQEGQTSPRADGGGAALLLVDVSCSVKPATWLMRQSATGLAPLLHLNGALPLDQSLSHRQNSDLPKKREEKAFGYGICV